MKQFSTSSTDGCTGWMRRSGDSETSHSARTSDRTGFWRLHSSTGEEPATLPPLTQVGHVVGGRAAEQTLVGPAGLERLPEEVRQAQAGLVLAGRVQRRTRASARTLPNSLRTRTETARLRFEQHLQFPTHNIRDESDPTPETRNVADQNCNFFEFFFPRQTRFETHDPKKETFDSSNNILVREKKVVSAGSFCK